MNFYTVNTTHLVKLIRDLEELSRKLYQKLMFNQYCKDPNYLQNVTRLAQSNNTLQAMKQELNYRFYYYNDLNQFWAEQA